MTRRIGRQRRLLRSSVIDLAVGAVTAGSRRPRFEPAEIVADAEHEAGASLRGDLHVDPLAVLCDDFGGAARLSPLGRVMARAQLTTNLANRIRVQSHVERHPDERRTVESPVFVVGLPRTGTTVLQHVMSLDPANRVLRAWETMSPAPPPRGPVDESDQRFRQSTKAFRAVNLIAPDAAAIHHVEPHLPTECIALLANSLGSMEYGGIHFVPGHLEWATTTDQRGHYDFLSDQLSVLGAGYPFDRWVLKSPAHLNELSTIAEVFPDARFVWTHRDPLASLTSHASLTAVLYRIGSAHVDTAAVGRLWLDVWTRAIERALAARRSIGDDRFIDLWHTDIVRDPGRGIGRVYEGLGWDLTDELERTVRRHVEEHPRDGRGRHRYDPADFGLDPGDVAERFAPYRDAYRFFDHCA